MCEVLGWCPSGPCVKMCIDTFPAQSIMKVDNVHSRTKKWIRPQGHQTALFTEENELSLKNKICRAPPVSLAPEHIWW